MANTRDFSQWATQFNQTHNAPGSLLIYNKDLVLNGTMSHSYHSHRRKTRFEIQNLPEPISR